MTTKNNTKKQTFTTQDKYILDTWQRAHQLRASTYKSYTSVIHTFVKVIGKPVHKIYEEAITEEENSVPRYRRKLNQYMMQFMDYMDKRGLADTTKNGWIYIIKSLYESFGVTIPIVRNNYPYNPKPENTEKLLTKDIIRTMIHNAGTRDKAILSLEAMTGQAVNEISNLTIRDITDCWNTELTNKIFDIPDIFKYKQDILQLQAPPMRITRQKTMNRYWFYLPQETTRYILDYIYERVSGNNSKVRIHSMEDSLFLTKHGNPMSSDALSHIFTHVGKMCGFETPELFDDKTRYLLERRDGDHRAYSSHKFRKYFINTCRRYAGTRPDTESEHVYTGKELADFWVGHQDRGSISSYLQYNEEDVLALQKHYLQVLPYLSIEMEVETITTQDRQEFLEMKEKYEEMREELEMWDDVKKRLQQLDLDKLKV